MKIFVKILILAIAAVVFGCLLFVISGVHKSVQAPVSAKNFQPEVCFGTNCFSVELAQTQQEQENGLMFRTQMDKNKGMLFIFGSQADYPFWMKNTLIPLDMVWIRKNPSTGSGQVVFIKENAEPCKEIICPVIDPKVAAEYVLEINGGISESMGLKVGDNVAFVSSIPKRNFF